MPSPTQVTSPATSPPTNPASATPGPSRTGIARRITLLALGATLAATLIIAWLGYRAIINIATRGYDDKLFAAALAMPDILPEGYIKGVRHRVTSNDEYVAICDRLDRFSSAAGVFYMYAMIEEDGSFLHAATSDRPEERGPGAMVAILTKYKEPPPAMFEALKTGKTAYASYTDEFGSFRSVFMVFGEGESRYIAGVDLRLSDIREAADHTLLRTVGVALGVSTVVGALGVWFGRKITRPITDLTRNVAAFTDDDFSDDSHAEEALSTLSEKDPTETGELAATLLFQQRRLRDYLSRFEEVTRDKQHILSQLQIAREIQLSLLPKDPPNMLGYQIAGWSEAADEAGGDFYDWFVAPSGAVVLAIADVTGHGIGPAIMASVCHAYGRATLKADQPLAPLVTKLNSLMAADLSDGRFCTHFTAVLYPEVNTLAFVSAGHGPVLIYRAATGAVEECHVHGLPLGVSADFEFDPDSTTTMEVGDVLLMASDGCWEYPNPDDVLFGTKRLSASLKAAAHGTPAEIIAHIRADVAAYTQGVKQPDDMTAVVVKRV